jgi:hypothetical protein
MPKAHEAIGRVLKKGWSRSSEKRDRFVLNPKSPIRRHICCFGVLVKLVRIMSVREFTMVTDLDSIRVMNFLMMQCFHMPRVDGMVLIMMMRH